MTTQKRAEAARRNGAKSRGPVTPAGKAVAARNSITHGLTARDTVLATESREAFQAYLQIFEDQFRPANAYEADLVLQLAGVAWRLRRAESIETALFDLEIDSNAAQIQALISNPDAPACWAFALKTLSDKSNAFANLDRHQSRLSRQYARIRLELERLRQSVSEEISPNEPRDEQPPSNQQLPGPPPPPEPAAVAARPPSFPVQPSKPPYGNEKAHFNCFPSSPPRSVDYTQTLVHV